MSVVLIVDDDPDVVEAMAMVLESEGYEVVSAADRDRALELAARRDPVLVIVDYRLPGVDPAELVAAIRAASVAKVALCTGAEGAEALGHATGADAVLSKPFSIEALLSLAESAARAHATPVVTP